MKKYAVDITVTALQDMESLYNYISDVLLDPQSALKQYNRIADAVLSLDEFPSRYPLFDCEPERSMGLHKMPADNYVVCYVIDSDRVTVTDILYGSSDIHSKLELRHTDETGSV